MRRTILIFILVAFSASGTTQGMPVPSRDVPTGESQDEYSGGSYSVASHTYWPSWVAAGVGLYMAIDAEEGNDYWG